MAVASLSPEHVSDLLGVGDGGGIEQFPANPKHSSCPQFQRNM